MPTTREDNDPLSLKANHKGLFLHPAKEESSGSTIVFCTETGAPLLM